MEQGRTDRLVFTDATGSSNRDGRIESERFDLDVYGGGRSGQVETQVLESLFSHTVLRLSDIFYAYAGLFSNGRDHGECRGRTRLWMGEPHMHIDSFLK